MKNKIYDYELNCDIQLGVDGKYYLLYKIVNIKTNQFYIGIHTTNNLSDGYSGSGKALQRSIELLGKHHFKKIIIGSYSTKEEMILAEAKFVTMEQVNDPNCYNLTIGGHYGGTNATRSLRGSKFMWHPATKQRTRVYPEMIQTYIENGWELKYGEVSEKIKRGTIAGKKYITKGNKTRVVDKSVVNKYIENGWLPGVVGFNHHRALINRKRMYNPKTNESKIISREKQKYYLDHGWLFGMGKRNPTGTMNWINKNGTYKKVYPHELQKYLEDGWTPGGPAKGTTHIYKGSSHKMIQTKFLQKYLEDGWTKTKFS